MTMGQVKPLLSFTKFSKLASLNRIIEVIYI